MSVRPHRLPFHAAAAAHGLGGCYADARRRRRRRRQGLTPDHTKAWNFIQFFREARPEAVSFPQYFKAAGYLAL